MIAPSVLGLARTLPKFEIGSVGAAGGHVELHRAVAGGGGQFELDLRGGTVGYRGVETFVEGNTVLADGGAGLTVIDQLQRVTAVGVCLAVGGVGSVHSAGERAEIDRYVRQRLAIDGHFAGNGDDVRYASAAGDGKADRHGDQHDT